MKFLDQIQQSGLGALFLFIYSAGILYFLPYELSNPVYCRNKEIQEGLEERMKERGLTMEGVVFRLFQDFNSAENLPS